MRPSRSAHLRRTMLQTGLALPDFKTVVFA